LFVTSQEKFILEVSKLPGEVAKLSAM